MNADELKKQLSVVIDSLDDGTVAKDHLRGIIAQAEATEARETRSRWGQICESLPIQTRHLVERQLREGSYRRGSLRKEEIMEVLHLELELLCRLDREKR